MHSFRIYTSYGQDVSLEYISFIGYKIILSKYHEKVTEKLRTYAYEILTH